MRQWTVTRSDQIAGATVFAPIFSTPTFNATESSQTLPASVAFTLSNFLLSVRTAPGVGTSYTYTVKKNGVATSLAITISGTNTSGSDTNPAHAVTYAIGDTFTLARTRSGLPTNDNVLFSFQVDTDTANMSVHGYGTNTNLATSAARFDGVLFGFQNPTVGDLGRSNIIAAAGTLTRYDILLSGAPGTAGSGKKYTFTISLNNVAQDGTGGTVNTVGVIEDTATSVSVTFSLPLVPGDKIVLGIVPASTPTARFFTCGSAFQATIDGESNICGTSDTNVSNSVTSYAYPTGFVKATETLVDSPSSIGGAYAVGKLQILLSGTPGAGNDYATTVRVNLATPSGAPSVIVSDVATSGSDLIHRAVINPMDTWDLEIVPNSTPTARAVLWGLVQNPAINPDPGVEGCFPFVGRMVGGAFVSRH